MRTQTDLRACRRAIADRHLGSNDTKGWLQILTTLLPLAGLWFLLAWPDLVPDWALAGVVLAMSFFLLRLFVLMHDCGHGSLFHSGALNRSVGFAFGVLAGIPQQVWAQHHLHHHATNGNWSRYRGPLNIITTAEYAALSAGQQQRYRILRNVWLAPIGGFLYLLFNPRLNWLIGSVRLLVHVVTAKIAAPARSIRAHAQEFSTPCCASLRIYGYMLCNNLAVLVLWGAMAWAVGPTRFFLCYALSLSLAGGAAIVLFTVQHNFEHSYASGDLGWDSGAAALRGTSFLILPGWLNWFTADIAYHHVHHLCAGVPNYGLARCHAEQAHLFTEVPRIRLEQIPRSLKFILWDVHAGCIVSVAQHLRQAAAADAPPASRSALAAPVAGAPAVS